MGKEIKKYNPEWLEAGCFGANWFINQQKYLWEAIESCAQLQLMLYVDNEEQMEAWAPILFKYSFTYKANVYYDKGILIINIK